MLVNALVLALYHDFTVGMSKPEKRIKSGMLNRIFPPKKPDLKVRATEYSPVLSGTFRDSSWDSMLTWRLYDSKLLTIFSTIFDENPRASASTDVTVILCPLQESVCRKLSFGRCEHF